MEEKRTKVLLVEDEKSLSGALADKFQQEGFDVLVAANGKKGLEIAFSEHPDLVVLDIAMPVMDGIGMAKKLREDVWGETVKLMVLTNLKSEVAVMNEMVDEDLTYLVKAHHSLSEVVAKAREVLGTDK